MSKEALKWAREQVVDHKQISEMLDRLAWEANSDGIARISQKTLAHHMRRSERYVRTAMMCLEKLGVIRREKRGLPGGGRRPDLIFLPIRSQVNIPRLDAKKIWDEVNSRTKGSHENPYKGTQRNNPRCEKAQTTPGGYINIASENTPVVNRNNPRVPPSKEENTNPELSGLSLATVEEDARSARDGLPLDLSDPLALCDIDSLANNPEYDDDPAYRSDLDDHGYLASLEVAA